MKDIWDNDCTDWNQFKDDQERNGKYINLTNNYIITPILV